MNGEKLRRRLIELKRDELRAAVSARMKFE
jgi:hypothetical protein